MLFSEVYSAYYNVIAQVLTEAVEGGLTNKRIDDIVRERAFGESVLTIPASLRSGAWPLLDGDNGTPIRHKPTMPLTTLERRWLKALLLDPRIALFSPSAEGLENVEPLFRPETVVLFDRYADGDPYTDPEYIELFHTILRAFRERRRLRIRFRGHRGRIATVNCAPYRLEYSTKDDKFRLITAGTSRPVTVNLARIDSCEFLESFDPLSLTAPRERKCRVTFLLRDERNALERVMLHFSHFEKTTVRLDDTLYEVRVTYDREDETELLIRILSFGPMVRVTEPAGFAAKLRERIERQAALFSGQ